MDLKRLVIFCATFMFLAGSAAHLQAADPEGVRVRADRDSAFAKIGDSILVQVLARSTILDTVIVTITNARDKMSASAFALARTLGAARVFDSTKTNTNQFSTSFTDSMVGSAAGARASKEVTTDGTTVTYSFRFGVAAGDAQSNKRDSLLIETFVVEQDSTRYERIDNQSTDEEFTGIAGTLVGDSKKFGIDGLRPPNSAFFDSVLIDTVKLAAIGNIGFGGSPTLNAAKLGDLITLKLHTRNIAASDAATAEVMLFDGLDTAAQKADSAYYSVSFTKSALLFNPGRDSIEVSAAPVGNQLRAYGNKKTVKAVAFLVDAAGNRSGPSAGGVEQPFSQNITYIIDSQKPTVTMTRPKAGTSDSDSLRFTAKTDTTIGLRSTSDGTFDGAVNFDLKPVVFTVDEKLRSATIRIDNSVDSTFALNLTAGVVDAEIATPIGSTSQSGSSSTVTVTVTDSSGNVTTEVIAGATHDERAPVISNFFPSSSSVPTNPDDGDAPTINSATQNASFRMNEEADSISLRVVRVAASTGHITANLSPGNNDLTKVDTDITLTVPADTLIDGQDYTYQLVVIDLAGNVNATEPDTMTFTSGFDNPGADSIQVALDPVHNEDSVIAGQAMNLVVTAIDSALTRAAGTNRKAVTYNKAGALVTVSATDDAGSKLAGHDLSGFTFDGTGVTDNLDGTATLDSDAWLVGERTVIVKSTLKFVNFTFTVQDTAGADGTVNFNGTKDSLTVDSAEFSAYSVTAWEDGVETTGVSGDFMVKVVPTDAWGNATRRRGR